MSKRKNQTPKPTAAPKTPPAPTPTPKPIPHLRSKVEIEAAIQSLKALGVVELEVLLHINGQQFDVPAKLFATGEIEIAGTRMLTDIAMREAFRTKVSWKPCTQAPPTATAATARAIPVHAPAVNQPTAQQPPAWISPQNVVAPYWPPVANTSNSGIGKTLLEALLVGIAIVALAMFASNHLNGIRTPPVVVYPSVQPISGVQPMPRIAAAPPITDQQPVVDASPTPSGLGATPPQGIAPFKIGEDLAIEAPGGCKAEGSNIVCNMAMEDLGDPGVFAFLGNTQTGGFAYLGGDNMPFSKVMFSNGFTTTLGSRNPVNFQVAFPDNGKGARTTNIVLNFSWKNGASQGVTIPGVPINR